MAAAEPLTELLARCALGDRRAFERLYRETSAQLFALVMRILRNRDLAKEVLQEGYVKIWNRAGDFRLDKASPITWMAVIMRNQAIDLLRRSAARPPTAEPPEELFWLADDAPQPQELADQAQRSKALHECIEQLSEEQRRVVLLAYFDGLTHEELADRLSAPLGTVKSWVRRGLLRLRDCLDTI